MGYSQAHQRPPEATSTPIEPCNHGIKRYLDNRQHDKRERHPAQKYDRKRRVRIENLEPKVGTKTDIGIVPAPGVSAAKEVLIGIDPAYAAQEITRMEAAVNNDP